ncbi:helix-hairpin-helix domain-containing protein [Rhodococcus sp. H29-C3]|uniref:helix-hairpin-helix domain-containing protein n=1 Tax=Rhodococcus sp. H29-C3 TaxID=3046307 RepID=UPI0024B9E776|nr:helix-hairpin-helix domain-containing protein [Rhodococcus sp. H29-C3]MDJ0363401.1 helix-hairpin-helix domain-containing protein [Rhodococcus sp. H29-C3]
MPTPTDGLPKIGAPATRALTTAGYKNLSDVIDVEPSELARLHGVGPKALRILNQALEDYGHRLM